MKTKSKWIALFALVAILALTLAACAQEEAPMKGSADGVKPGLWIGADPESNSAKGADFDNGWAICFNVNADGTALTATSDCDVDQEESPPQPYLLEVQWANDAGKDQDGGNCNGGTGLTDEISVPIENGGFKIDYTDGGGGVWEIVGTFDGDTATGSAKRTFDPWHCELPEWTAQAP